MDKKRYSLWPKDLDKIKKELAGKVDEQIYLKVEEGRSLYPFLKVESENLRGTFTQMKAHLFSKQGHISVDGAGDFELMKLFEKMYPVSINL